MNQRHAVKGALRIREALGRSGVFFLVCLTLWILWVVLSAVITGQSLSVSSPHLVTPVVLTVGLVGGWLLSQRWAQEKLGVIAAVLAGITIAAAPIYANASAAVGVLLVALSAVMIKDARRTPADGNGAGTEAEAPDPLDSGAVAASSPLASQQPTGETGSVASTTAATSARPAWLKKFLRRRSQPVSNRPPASTVLSGRGSLPWRSGDGRVSWRSSRTQQAVLCLILTLTGVLLALGSQAALLLLAVLLVVICACALVGSGPTRWITVTAGIFAAEIAAAAVVLLGSREQWPTWLAAGSSLSSARHTLWADAIALWQDHPVIGAGPGTFTASSELATTTPHLAATHSLFLQVPAELGTIGLVLLVSIFITGLLLATGSDRVTGAIAGTAWTCLAIHSAIDHLEDFPVVALTAGLVLGWARRRQTEMAPDRA